MKFQRSLTILIMGSLIACTHPPNYQSPTPLTPSPASSPTHLPTYPPPHTPSPLPTRPPATLASPTYTPLPLTPTPLHTSLTLDQKLGLLLIAGLNGTELTRETQLLITNYHITAFVLRGRNIFNAQQLQALLTGLRSLTPDPLLIAADQEGGDVTRLTDGLTHFPSAMALGAADDPDLAYQVGYVTAQELLTFGVNVNLAPVLDTLTDPANTTIGLRSFGNNAALVGELGTHFMRGTLEAGVIPVLKHYPGHGGTATDSHAGLPAIDRLDLEPFDTAIAAGAPVVMLGHLWVRPLDPAPLPASLSPRIIARLRQNFEGVILTDSLNMGAITNQQPAPQAALAAFLAGADWLLIAEPADVPPTLALLHAAYERGDISPERLEASVQRLLDLQTHLGRATAPAPPLPSGADLALSVSTRALTVTCSPNILCAPRIPSDTKKILLIAPSHIPSAPADPNHLTYLAQLLAERGYRVTELLYDPQAGTPRDLTAQAELYALANDLTLFGAWDAHLTATAFQIQTVHRLQATHKPLITIGFHLPFDLQVLDAPLYLATFGDTPAQMEALILAITGAVLPQQR